jgi:hypothetical protein
MVHQITTPRAARAISTLPRIDYEDAFLAETELVSERTGEEWARAILEGAPLAAQAQLRWGWLMLGLRLGWPGSDGHVLGWKVRHSEPNFVLLGAGSWVGMPAELLCQRQADGLLFATFVQHQNPIVRAAWAAVEPVHVQVVPRLIAPAVAWR